jgi:hypothetical protein
LEFTGGNHHSVSSSDEGIHQSREMNSLRPTIDTSDTRKSGSLSNDIGVIEHNLFILLKPVRNGRISFKTERNVLRKILLPLAITGR